MSRPALLRWLAVVLLALLVPRASAVSDGAIDRRLVASLLHGQRAIADMPKSERAAARRLRRAVRRLERVLDLADTDPRVAESAEDLSSAAGTLSAVQAVVEADEDFVTAEQAALVRKALDVVLATTLFDAVHDSEPALPSWKAKRVGNRFDKLLHRDLPVVDATLGDGFVKGNRKAGRRLARGNRRLAGIVKSARAVVLREDPELGFDASWGPLTEAVTTFATVVEELLERPDTADVEDVDAAILAAREAIQSSRLFQDTDDAKVKLGTTGSFDLSSGDTDVRLIDVKDKVQVYDVLLVRALRGDLHLDGVTVRCAGGAKQFFPNDIKDFDEGDQQLYTLVDCPALGQGIDWIAFDARTKPGSDKEGRIQAWGIYLTPSEKATLDESEGGDAAGSFLLPPSVLADPATSAAAGPR